jgi:hypothetical protein
MAIFDQCTFLLEKDCLFEKFGTNYKGIKVKLLPQFWFTLSEGILPK